MSNQVKEGREWIAGLAERDGEHVFAAEVRAGCWDHRADVAKAIRGERFPVRKLGGDQ